MKRIFTLLLMLVGVAATAQQFNNEWIKFSQTYYKFKIANAGLVRIPKNVLDAAGIGNTQVQFFELWRNGQKVPFYPSVASGALPSNGYLEFWGEPNDGKPDKPLYRDPTYQHVDKYSLQTDTVVYFLSVNTDQSGIRYIDVANNVGANILPVEPYFMYTAGRYNKDRINQGFAVDLKEYLYSSSYDKGEFWSSGDIRPATPYLTSLTGLSVYSGGPDATFRFGMSGNTLNARTVKTTVNNTEVSNVVMDYFNEYQSSGTIPLSLISSGSADVQFTNGSAISTDRMVVSYYEFIYPREFKFGNAKNFRFTLPAKPAGYFLQIKEFDYGVTAPVLLDVASGQRFTGDITTTPGSISFALPGSAIARDLVLVNAEAGNIARTINALTPKTFVNYTLAANQGDYLIITHPLLYTGSTGNNPVNDYKAYRESAQGGGYKVSIANIDDLVDQFAFGIAKHPLSVRNYLAFARSKFPNALKNVFLIGRGMNYYEYNYNLTDPIIDKLNIIPTFGNPGSDNLLSSVTVTNPVPATPIGRLSVVRGQEIEYYLDKLKQYENAQMNAPNTLAAREWMKNVVHVTGSNEAYLGTILCNYMGVYEQLIEDTLYGGKVTTFCKTSTGTTDQLASERIAQLFEEGISFLNYFGHSSATTLEFNLDNPQAYNNAGKYPVFLVNGCNAGNFFTYYPQRLTANETLSEKFVLANQRGSIAFVASTHFGIVNYLNLYLTNLYSAIGHTDFDKTLGESSRDAFQNMLNSTGIGDFYTRIHAEQITLHGDPALRINAQAKPDYVVEKSSIKINPAFISVAEASFELKLRMVNLGRAKNDSIMISIQQVYPNKTSAIIYHQKIKGIRYADSITMSVPIVATRDIGQHTINVVIDEGNAVQEMDEGNNVASTDFYIFQDEARPVYPYNYGIVNQQGQKLFSSTANAFSGQKSYILEIDTTQNFNSSIKVSKKLTSNGGVLEFEPGLSYLDSTVYYWRTALDVGGNNTPQWSNASFVFINDNTIEGFNQSHYFQHQKSELNHIIYGEDRKWTFSTSRHRLFLQNTVYPTGSNQIAAFHVAIDDLPVMGAGCEYNELIFNIIDPVTFKPWKNDYTGATGLYNSKNIAGCTSGGRAYNFLYGYQDVASRKKAMDFMDAIPNGYYVTVRANTSPGYSPYPANVYVDQWKADTLLYGSGNSLYHKLLNAGFLELDSFYTARTYSFVYKKGDLSQAPKYAFSPNVTDRLTLSVDCQTRDTLGYITSPKFGPATKWKEVRWKGASVEQPSVDHASVDVIGVDVNNMESTIYTLDDNTHTFDVSGIDPIQYPYLRLRMRNEDSVSLTPYQLKSWNIIYKPVPEGALAPNLFVISKDTIELGEPLKFDIAFKNVSKMPFDSLVIKASILDKNNVTHIIDIPKSKPLVAGDTIVVRFELDSKLYPGVNTIFLNVNPDNTQPEEYSFNNFVFRNVFVRTDNFNPLLDVTFDGMHILNRDIVSAKPHIQIKLKDEAKYLLLNDTALTTVQVKYPNGVTRDYHFDNDTLRFTPPTSGADNSAILDFTPAFINQLNPEGDDYTLIVKGKDRSGNVAGAAEYKVSFRVINKPMISNLLNYPNPFSTSTAFVFTITGSEIPQNIKIQILTVTGKIVREITIDELGPLRIGRNITQYKWDGNDQYGQKLANGVYLYRVVTTLNGRPMDKYKAKSDNTDQFFNNGYGKMYLMR